MPLIDTPDGHYTHAITTANEGDGNDVVYDNWIVPGKKTPVWDKFSYESKLIPINPPIINPSNPGIVNNKPILIKSGVNPIGMSYWRNINYHERQNILYILLSINDELIIFTIDKLSLTVLSEKGLGIHHTGEGCHFSAINSSKLFVPTDKELYTIDINTGAKSVVWNLLDGNNLWQCHISHDDNIHSATIKDENYNIVKWGAHNNFNGTKYFNIQGDPDECQADKSGKWLIIKEDNYNRIVYIETRAERLITNEEGALGHSDCGFEFAIGENDMSSKPGALDMINFINGSKSNIFSTGIWNMGYVSCTNAPSDFCLVTTPNELIRVWFDGRSKVICPNLTQSQKYEHRPKANLCPLGEYAVWTAFVDGSLNAYLVRL